MPRLAWFNCFSGIAGDMALGALIDAGADRDSVIELVKRLPVDGLRLEFEPVMRCGLVATKAKVFPVETTSHRTAASILSMIGFSSTVIYKILSAILASTFLKKFVE